jgi:hypothetical protein
MVLRGLAMRSYLMYLVARFGLVKPGLNVNSTSITQI